MARINQSSNDAFRNSFLVKNQQQSAALDRVSAKNQQAASEKNLKRVMQLVEDLMKSDATSQPYQLKPLDLFNSSKPKQGDIVTISAAAVAAQNQAAGGAITATLQNSAITGTAVTGTTPQNVATQVMAAEPPLTYARPRQTPQPPPEPPVNETTGNQAYQAQNAAILSTPNSEAPTSEQFAAPAAPTDAAANSSSQFAGQAAPETVGISADQVTSTEAQAVGQATGAGAAPPELEETLNMAISMLDEMGELTALSASLKYDDAAGNRFNVTDETRATNQERFDVLRNQLTDLVNNTEIGGLAVMRGEGGLVNLSGVVESLQDTNISTLEGGQNAVSQVFGGLQNVKVEKERLFGPPPEATPVVTEPQRAAYQQTGETTTDQQPFRGNDSYVWID